MNTGDDLSSMTMLGLFKIEAENHCASLGEDLAAMEREPAAADRLESMMRAAHSIKGAAAVVGLQPLVRLAHALEEVLVAARQGRVTLGAVEVELLLKGVDGIAQAARLEEEEVEGWFTGHAGELDPVVQALVTLVKQAPAEVKKTGRRASDARQSPPPPRMTMPWPGLATCRCWGSSRSRPRATAPP